MASAVLSSFKTQGIPYNGGKLYYVNGCMIHLGPNEELISKTEMKPCSVCSTPTTDLHYVSLCGSCESSGFDADQYYQKFLPYYLATAIGEVRVEVVQQRSEENGNREFIRIIREQGKLSGQRGLVTDNTLAKRESVLQNSHRVNLENLFQEGYGLCSYILGDYLKKTRSVTKVSHVKRAFLLKNFAKEIHPENPVAVLKYLETRPDIGKNGKMIVIEGVKAEYLAARQNMI